MIPHKNLPFPGDPHKGEAIILASCLGLFGVAELSAIGGLSYLADKVFK